MIDAGVTFDAGDEHDAGDATDAGIEVDAGNPEPCLATNDAGWPMWGEPVNVKAVNSPWEEASPTITADRLRLCFCSNRPGGAGNRDIYCASRPTVADPWGAAVNQTLVNTTHLEWMPSLSADGAELFFAAELPNSLSQDLFVSIYDAALGQYGPPQALTALNTTFWQTGPGISEDGLTLYYGQPLPNGVGSTDIYSAKRATRQSPWGAAQLEPSVNSPAQDELPKEDPSGRKLLLCSNRPGNAAVPPDTFALYGAMRMGPGWTPAILLDVKGPAAGSGWSPSILSDGSLLFASSRSGGLGDADIYLAPPVRCDH